MTDVVVTGNLTVKKESDFDGMITCRSDSFFTGFLRVGALAAVGFNVLEFAQVNQTLNVTGNTTMAGNLTVNGEDGLFVEGPLIVNDIIRTNTPHGIVCGGQLAVAQNAVLQAAISVGNNATIAGTLSVGSNATITGTLSAGATNLRRPIIAPSVFTILSSTQTNSVVILGANNPAQSYSVVLPTNPPPGTIFTFVTNQNSLSTTYTIETGGGNDILSFTTDGGTFKSGVTSMFTNKSGSLITLVFTDIIHTWHGIVKAVGWQ